MNRPVTLAVFLVIPALLWAQKDSVQKVPYNADFKFKDGIYLSFEQVKNNQPVLSSRIVTNRDVNDPQFYEGILANKEISFYDNLGMKQNVSVKSIWGFSKNGTLFIRMYESYNRITYVGSICHFIANITVQSGYNDPYYYNPYYYYRSWNTSPQTTTEMRQFIMDFETGKILDYDEDSVEVLLMKDPQLHDEFAALSKKKRQQMKFLYIRKFNERNPLLIPN